MDQDTSGQIIINRAALFSFDQVDANSANNSAFAEIDVQKADMQITQAVNNATPDEGKVIVYTINAKNLGPSLATGVVVEDMLPAGVTYVSHVADQGIYDRRTGLWVVGDLASGQNRDLLISARVDAGTSGNRIDNLASLRSVDQQDPGHGQQQRHRAHRRAHRRSAGAQER